MRHQDNSLSANSTLSTYRALPIPRPITLGTFLLALGYPQNRRVPKHGVAARTEATRGHRVALDWPNIARPQLLRAAHSMFNVTV